MHHKFAFTLVRSSPLVKVCVTLKSSLLVYGQYSVATTVNVKSSLFKSPLSQRCLKGLDLPTIDKYSQHAQILTLQIFGENAISAL